MRRTTLHLVVAVAVSLSASPVLAQGYTTLGLELRLGTPAGEFGDWHRRGIGAAVSAEYDLSVDWRATADVVYATFSGKAIRGIPDPAPDLRVAGASVGFRTFIGATPVYVGGAFGAFAYHASRTHYSNAGLRRDFGVLPAVGYRTGTFDITAQYKLSGEAQWMDVRAGLRVVRF